MQDAFTERYVNESVSDVVAAAKITTSTDVPTVSASFLELYGSFNMANWLNIRSNGVTNVAEPISAQDAVTKNYADSY